MNNPFGPNASIASEGAEITNELEAVTSPCGVWTVMGPVLAPGGTMAVILRSALLPRALMKLALTPLKSTAVAPVKFVPVRMVLLPSAPCAGEKPAPVKSGGGVGYHASVKAPMPSEGEFPITT